MHCLLCVAFYHTKGYWGQLRGYEVTPKSFNLLTNSSLYYLIIQAVILTSCCVIMTACTIYIFYKIKTNKFKGRVTERRKQEKRSLIMFVVVLFVFLISEVPKVCVYLIFCIKYMAGFDAWRSIISSEQVQFIRSMRILQNFKNDMVLYLTYHTDVFNDVLPDPRDRVDFFFFFLEVMKLFTIIGCMSNFIIYISMSSKLRREIRRMLKLTWTHFDVYTM